MRKRRVVQFCKESKKPGAIFHRAKPCWNGEKHSQESKEFLVKKIREVGVGAISLNHEVPGRSDMGSSRDNGVIEWGAHPSNR